MCCGSEKATNRCYILHKELSWYHSSLETFQHSETMILGFILLQGGKVKQGGWMWQSKLN